MSTVSSFLKTGSAQLLPRVQWHAHNGNGHVVQFYSDDVFLVEELAHFIGAALRAGESAVVVATETHRNELVQLLANRHDLAEAIRDGRFSPLDAAETLAKFMRDGHPDPARFAEIIGAVLERAKARSGGRRVVVFGEMVMLLWVQGNREGALELEQLWNDLAQKHVFSLRCAYPLNAFRSEEDSRLFSKICSEHSTVIPSEGYTALGGDDERLRNIAQLQQKAQALEFERTQQASLRAANLQLQTEASARREELRKLGDSEEALRELSNRLLRTHDEERRHLGLNLHDSVAQYLAVLKMALEMLGSDNPPAANLAKQLIAECIPLLERSIEELRAASYLLHPPMIDESGLRAAILWHLSGFTKDTGIQVTLDIAPGFVRLPKEIELPIFRVLQEGLANVHQHSGSSTAAVSLRRENGAVCLEIRDSGKGIPLDALQSCEGNPGKLGIGFRAMQERLLQVGGQLHLSSTATGTTLTVSVPLA